MSSRQLVSIIVPVYNEAPNIPVLHDRIRKIAGKLPYAFEYLFVDDGSRDDSAEAVQKLARKSKNVRLIELSRNFGKEAAVSAGLHAAGGDAAIILDADLQHPPMLINSFLQKWKHGAEVVVGIKRYGRGDSWFKRFSSDWFYRLFRMVAEGEVTPHGADYRLLDRRVINAFGSMKEHNRITRGLIDWLGFRRDYVHFDVAPRLHGQRSYTFRKLFALALHTFTSYSLLPLQLASYLGYFMLLVTIPTGIFLAVDKFVLGDPLTLHVTSAGLLALLNVFLIGMVLACMGMMGLYIARINAEVTGRPLYVIRDHIGSDQVVLRKTEQEWNLVDPEAEHAPVPELLEQRK
jgi:glycosyltransferase involved in cell wall biosynthesis